MYKSGKKWLITPLLFVSFGVGMYASQDVASADRIDTDPNYSSVAYRGTLSKSGAVNGPQTNVAQPAVTPSSLNSSGQSMASASTNKSYLSSSSLSKSIANQLSRELSGRVIFANQLSEKDNSASNSNVEQVAFAVQSLPITQQQIQTTKAFVDQYHNAPAFVPILNNPDYSRGNRITSMPDYTAWLDAMNTNKGWSDWHDTDQSC